MRTEFLFFSVLRVASGPRVKLASCKSVLYSTDRSKAVVQVLDLLFEAICFMSYFVLFCLFGEERANLGAFRAFVPFVLVLFFRFSLPLGV